MNGVDPFNPAEPLDWDAVAKANRDLGERLATDGLSIAYDDSEDTLLATVGVGQGHEAITEEVADNIYIRIEPASLLIVGFMILNFASDFLANNKLAKKTLGDWFLGLRSAGGATNLEGSDAKKMEPILLAALSH